jgi:hypothetical protein
MQGGKLNRPKVIVLRWMLNQMQGGKLNRPKVPYCSKLTERKDVLRWLKTLKFLDRYAANIK